MYSPVPNAYFARFVNKETQQDSSQNTVNQPGTSVQQEAHPITECTDEELMSALSQAEEYAATTADTSRGDSEQISEDSQTARNLFSDAQCATENHDVSMLDRGQTTLDRSVSGGEGATFVDEEMNMELSSQCGSVEQADESNKISPSGEAYNGPSRSSEQVSSSGMTDHGDTTWISCMVGKMISLNVY